MQQNNTTQQNNNMGPTNYQSTHQPTTGGSSPPDNKKRRHNTLKERIKRSMNKAGEATVRRRASVLDAACALASLADDGRKIIDVEANTQMVDNTGQPSSKANDLHEERWRAATTAEEEPVTFPQKLMAVLETDQLSDVITWLPHGKGFIILQKKKFASDIMPLYFKHSKFTSFTRKLNRWGFTRVPRGPETGAYYHKYFQKGNHDLCMQMHCHSKPNATNNSPRPSPPPPVESPKVVAVEVKVPASPGSKVVAAMSALRVESSPLNRSSPLNNQDSHVRIDFKTTLSRQQELLREDWDDKLHKKQKLMQEQQQYAQKSSLAALYQSSRRVGSNPERKMKKKVEVPSNLPPMPSLDSSSGHRQNQSLLSSLSSSAGQQLHQSLPSSFTASGSSPYASLRNSWNTEPNSHTSMTSPRAEHPPEHSHRRQQHHLKGIDWSKISNYSMQDERRELPDHGMADQYRPNLLVRQGPSMATRRQMTPPAPALAYETMLNDYKRNILALDTASSTQHRNVIQSALNALQASNDRGYLTMLMQREHEKAQGRVAPDDYASQRGAQSRVAAMQAQMRQLEQLRSARSGYSPTDIAQTERRVEQSQQAQTDSRVEQLQQHMKHLSSAHYVQADPQGTPINPPPMGQHPPGVRRASAA